MKRIWQLTMRAGRGAARRVWRGLGWAFFTLSCVAAMIVALGILVQQVVAEKPSPAVITSAGALVLLSALFARHGEVISSRLKKLGPLELFEEVREALANLEDIASKVPVVGFSEDALVVRPAKLSPEEEFAFRQGDLFAAMLLFSGTEPVRDSLRRRYYELLYKVGACAWSQKEWPRATARLGRLEELSGGAYEPRGVLYLTGTAWLTWGESSGAAATEKQQYFGKARRQLKKLIDLGDAPASAYFFLAWTQDELGQWHEAIASNREMLERRPRCAPAKYNSAISFIKLHRLNDAYRMLARISVEDEDLDLVLAVYKDDQELLPKVDDVYWRKSIELLLRKLERQWGERPR
jgi:tetratricopeptide (TPR) repeat protein